MQRLAELERAEVGGVRAYRFSAMVAILADEFYYSPLYVERKIQQLKKYGLQPVTSDPSV